MIERLIARPSPAPPVARLRDASNEEILGFLKRYEGSAIADRLRNDWLLLLGQRRDFRLGEELAKRLGWLMPPSSRPVQAADVARHIAGFFPGMSAAELQTAVERYRALLARQQREIASR